jgi:hypothetical protein
MKTIPMNVLERVTGGAPIWQWFMSPAATAWKELGKKGYNDGYRKGMEPCT